MLLLFSCNKTEETPWDNPTGFYKDFSKSYYENSIGTKSKEKSGNQSVYVDFSDGLVQAYTSVTNKNVIDFMASKLVGSGIDWYGLGKQHKGIGKLEYANDRDVYNKVVSEASYVDLMSPIEEALKKITSSKNDAILITDFEEYTPEGQEQKFSYAKQYFKSWVEAGNSITFYYSSYTENNKKSKLSGSKNLYFAIFNYGNPGEGSLLDLFNKAIENRDLTNLKSFEINTNVYKVVNDYGGKDKTGLCPVLEDDKNLYNVGDQSGTLTYYLNGSLEQLPFESIEFGLGMDMLSKDFTDNARFTKKLFLDASKSPSYDLKSVKIQVSDVTSDYENFVKSKEALNHKPVLTEDEGNNKVWDEKSKNDVIIQECYNTNSTDLKDEYKYSFNKKGDVKVVDEIFDLDKNIFSDHLKNSPDKIELITKFHQNFDASKLADLGNGESIILRVDYVIDSAEPKIESSQLDDFKWNSVINKGNGVNTSLYESVRNTIQDIKPKGILYTYYLKFQPNKD